MIFGDAAINYDEGKWVLVNHKHVFRRNYTVQKIPGGRMNSFIRNTNDARYKTGTFASGSAVREDAQEILESLARPT